MFVALIEKDIAFFNYYKINLSYFKINYFAKSEQFHSFYLIISSQNCKNSGV